MALTVPKKVPTVSFYLSGFTPGARGYPVAIHQVVLGTVTSLLGTVTGDVAGRVSFSDTPASGGNYVYVAGRCPPSHDPGCVSYCSALYRVC